MKISNYDEHNYDYSTYWDNRKYEQEAEDYAVSRLMNKLPKNMKFKRVVDLGGSFGRNIKHFKGNTSEQVIVDYSLKTLQKNHSFLIKQYPDIKLIAANVYKLPFKDNSFDLSLMVRVLHHLDQPGVYFKELARINATGGFHIQEFSNKFHIKAVLRNLIHFNKSFFRNTKYQQPTAGNHEGSQSSENVTFLNFPVRLVKRFFKQHRFKLLSSRDASFFRIPFLKRYIPSQILIFTEKVVQEVFRLIPIAPSRFMILRNDGFNKNVLNNEEFESILVCPVCKSELKFTKNLATCTNKDCKNKFKKDKNVWDFRV